MAGVPMVSGKIVPVRDGISTLRRSLTEAPGSLDSVMVQM
jgi:hypothetical protein